MNNSKLALNLSKTSIQLLKKGNKKSWNVLGSVDPSSRNLEKDLDTLKNQAAALSSKRPVVDILLPRELVLSQTIVIEDDFSIEHCKKVTAKRCGLNENEILIAIGDSSTRSTVPIAAISANSITESRNFVKKAGFRPERYIASSKISGFKKSPVFFNDNSSKRFFDLEGKTFTRALALTSILLFAGFLVSLTSAFFEYRANNKPYKYLADSKFFFQKEKIKQNELALLEKAKKISASRLDPSIFEPRISNFDYTLHKNNNQRPKLNLINKFSVTAQLKANLKTTQIKELAPAEMIMPILIPNNSKQFNDIKELSMLENASLLNLTANSLRKTNGSLPKIDEDFSNLINQKKKLSKEGLNVSNSLANRRVFVPPEKESNINHEYKKIVVEEIFSDISLTKILITTVNKQASSLPLLYFNTQKPDILTPENLMGIKFINDKKQALINPNEAMQEKLLFSALAQSFENKLNLDHQFNLKLKKQGLDIKLLNKYKEGQQTQLALWNGKKPFIKPKIIDSIKVLEDPTKSTGAVTFVELPPKIPTVISELKKVAASSVRNLRVRSNPPSIPKRASIVGNSTLKNLIELNRTNLIGIFGKRTGRIALIRLSSGNTIKVKVGQQFGNGWKVISIDLDKIHITNGSRQETLRIPG